MIAFALLVFGCGTPDAPPGSEGGSGGDSGAQDTARDTAGSYTRVSPEELSGALQGGDLLLVDTHVPFAGDIPGTDFSVPYAQIEESLERLPADKGIRIALYCRSGSMSAIRLEDAGPARL